MKDWRQIEQLDDVEKPESLEYICTKFGVYKMSHKNASNFLYFNCKKNCGFLMRWDKRSGALQALREHNHALELRSRRRKKRAKPMKLNAEEFSSNETKDAVLPTKKEEENKINQPTAFPAANIQQKHNFSVPKKNNSKKPTKNLTKENTKTGDPLQRSELDLNKPKWWKDLDKVLLPNKQLEIFVDEQKAQREQQFNAFKESIKQILFATTKANKDKRGAYWDEEKEYEEEEE